MRPLLLTTAAFMLALPAAAQPVDGLWAVIPDGASAVKLGLIGRQEGDDELRLFRISCDKWGAVDLVFFGEAGLSEQSRYDLTLSVDGRPLSFNGPAERSELGTVLFWSATVPRDHPLMRRLDGADRLDLTINNRRFRLPTTQLRWAISDFRDWCADLAPDDGQETRTPAKAGEIAILRDATRRAAPQDEDFQ